MFSEYRHIRLFAKQVVDYFENTKGNLYTYFMEVSFMLYQMQFNAKFDSQYAVFTLINNRL